MRLRLFLKAARSFAPEEKSRLGVDPTTSSEAYVLYLTALGKEATNRFIYSRYSSFTSRPQRLIPGSPWLTPELPYATAAISSLTENLNESRKRAPRRRTALRLSPDLGEAHMAPGLCLYSADKNYTVALKEFEIAAAR